MSKEKNGDGLRLLRLTVRDFKRIRLVNAALGPGATIVAGRNNQGKSSLLDSIPSLFGGKRVCPPRPVRLGAEDAELIGLLGGEDGRPALEILRTFAPDGATRLRVRTPDGAEYQSPQKRLDAMVGPFLDPLAFTRLSPLEQKKSLLDLLDLGDFDLAASEALERGAAEDRKILRRDWEKIVAERNGIQLPPDLPVKAPDVSKALAALDLATRTAANIAAGKTILDAARREAAAAQAAVDLTRKRMAEHVERARKALAQAERDAADAVQDAQQKVTEKTERVRDLEAEAKDAKEPDVAGAQAAVASAREVEAQVRQRDRWRKLDADAEDLEKKIMALSAKVDGERGAREKALSAAGMPVEDLAVTDDGITYRGLPFSQASQSEQLRVSVALATARNPKFRCLRVQEAQVLDPENLALVCEEADRRGFQVILERVDPEGADLVIEDGAVLSVPEKTGTAAEPAAKKTSKKKGAKA